MTLEPPEPTFTIEPRGSGSGCGPWHRPRLRSEHTSRATALLPGLAELSQAAPYGLLTPKPCLLP